MTETMPEKGIKRYLYRDDDFHYTEPIDEPGKIEMWPRHVKLAKDENLCMVVRGAVNGEDDEFRYTVDILNNGSIIKNKHPLHPEMPKEELWEKVVAPMFLKMLKNVYAKRELEKIDKEEKKEEDAK